MSRFLNQVPTVVNTSTHTRTPSPTLATSKCSTATSLDVGSLLQQVGERFLLTGPKPNKIKVETFRIDYLIRAPKVEKLSLQPII